MNIHQKLDEALRSLHRIELGLRLVETKENRIMDGLKDLQADVEEGVTVEQSAITLLNGLSAEIASLQPNQKAIDDLAAKVKASSDALAAAVAANTPAAVTVTTP